MIREELIILFCSLGDCYHDEKKMLLIMIIMGLQLAFKPEELGMHQKAARMQKNLPPSWGCKTITGLFELQDKGFI